MRILICDDEKEFADDLQTKLEKYMHLRCIGCEITNVNDPTAIMCNDCVYDLAFLDIQMPQCDGITLAKELRKRNRKLALFFITNFDEFQDDAMDLQALRFFEKPLQENRLFSGLDKAMEYIDGAYLDFFLSENSIQQRIIADDVLYVTRDGRKTAIVTNRQTYLTREGFDDLCARLPQLFFYMVHKSYFVNLHYVQRYDYHELELSDGTIISIASRKQAEFRKFWFAYIRRC